MLLRLSLPLVELVGPEGEEGDGEPEDVVAEDKLELSDAEIASCQEPVGEVEVVGEEAGWLADTGPEFKAVFVSVDGVDFLQLVLGNPAQLLAGLE